MKKISIKSANFICLSLIALTIRSQTLQESIDYQFALLNSNKISTGMLINKVLSFSNIGAFDGVHDTVCDYETFQEIHRELYYNEKKKTNRA